MDETESPVTMDPHPFGLASCSAPNFIPDSLTKLRYTLEKIADEVHKESFYDDWYLKEGIPKMWPRVLWVLSHPDGPPPDDALIADFLERLGARIEPFADYPPLSYDVFFRRELEKVVGEISSKWLAGSDVDFGFVNFRFIDTITGIMRVKAEYFRDLAMMYR